MHKVTSITLAYRPLEKAIWVDEFHIINIIPRYTIPQWSFPPLATASSLSFCYDSCITAFHILSPQSNINGRGKKDWRTKQADQNYFTQQQLTSTTWNISARYEINTLLSLSFISTKAPHTHNAKWQQPKPELDQRQFPESQNTRPTQKVSQGSSHIVHKPQEEQPWHHRGKRGNAKQNPKRKRRRRYFKIPTSYAYKCDHFFFIFDFLQLLSRDSGFLM